MYYYVLPVLCRYFMRKMLQVYFCVCSHVFMYALYVINSHCIQVLMRVHMLVSIYSGPELCKNTNRCNCDVMILNISPNRFQCQ